MHAQEFVRRFKKLLEDPDSRFVFFLGAGCSVSSGVPSATTLVRQWMSRLKMLQTGNENNLQEWINKEFSDYDKDNPAAFYGNIIEKLFLTKEARQKEIERLTEEKDPGFGYAVLSKIMSSNSFGRHCNIILTTNFDDMVADALYLYTNKKPLVVAHESLVNFVRISRARPLVIKLHGDAKLSPKNTGQETGDLDDSVKTVLKSLLSEVGIVFIGYGGNDKSIVNILSDLNKDSLPGGVWWINSEMPDNDMGQWLKERDVKFVEHNDFDELMLLMLTEFQLDHPEGKRFDKLIKKYFETFEKLKVKIEAKPETNDSKSLKEAINIASEKIIEEGEYSYAIVDEAKNYEKTDPLKAQVIYQKGLGRFQNDPWFLLQYANFLRKILKDNDRAEELYKKAIAADSNYAYALTNYADFLREVCEDYDRAEGLYKKAIDSEQVNVFTFTAYADFLREVRKDDDRADELYKIAINIEPDNAFVLSCYADFMRKVRKDNDRAEELYERAVDAWPDYGYALTFYADFMRKVRKDNDRAEELYERAIDVWPDYAFALTFYANFLREVREDNDRAEELYKRALESEPNYEYALTSYTDFLRKVREDNDKADQLIKQYKHK